MRSRVFELLNGQTSAVCVASKTKCIGPLSDDGGIVPRPPALVNAATLLADSTTRVAAPLGSDGQQGVRVVPSSVAHNGGPRNGVRRAITGDMCGSTTRSPGPSRTSEGDVRRQPRRGTAGAPGD